MLACTPCGRGNFADFRFCAQCGYARRWIGLPPAASVRSDTPVPDLEAIIAARLSALQSRFRAKPSVKVKDSLLCKFEAFLLASGLPFSLTTVGPDLVVHFLVWRDLSGQGSVVVHALDCFALSLLFTSDLATTLSTGCYVCLHLLLGGGVVPMCKS